MKLPSCRQNLLKENSKTSKKKRHRKTNSLMNIRVVDNITKTPRINVQVKDDEAMNSKRKNDLSMNDKNEKSKKEINAKEREFDIGSNKSSFIHNDDLKFNKNDHYYNEKDEMFDTITNKDYKRPILEESQYNTFSNNIKLDISPIEYKNIKDLNDLNDLKALKNLKDLKDLKSKNPALGQYQELSHCHCHCQDQDQGQEQCKCLGQDINQKSKNNSPLIQNNNTVNNQIGN